MTGEEKAIIYRKTNKSWEEFAIVTMQDAEDLVELLLTAQETVLGMNK